VCQGAPNVKDYLPDPDAAINIADYKSIADLAQYLKKISADEKLYAKHLAWKKKPFSSQFLYRLNHGLDPYCNLCDHMAENGLQSLGDSVPSKVPTARRFVRAIGNGDRAEMIQVLHDAPDVLDAPDELNGGQHPIHIAAQSGHTSMAELLLSLGADVNGLDLFGKTPCHISCEKGDYKTAMVFIRYGAQFDLKDSRNDSARQNCRSWDGRNDIGQRSFKDLLAFHKINGSTAVGTRVEANGARR
jgi:ankyrin repeat protein